MPRHAVVPQLHQAGEDLHRQHEIRLQLCIGHVEHVVDLLDFRGALAHAALEVGVQAAQLVVLPLRQFGQFAIAEFEVAPRQGFANHQQDVVVVPGLGDIAVNFSAVDRRDGRADVGVSGQQDAHGVRLQAPHPFEELRPVHAWHSHVRDHQVNRVVGDELQCGRAALGRKDPISLWTEQPPQRIENGRLVVHQQQRGARLGGRRIRIGR